MTKIERGIVFSKLFTGKIVFSDYFSVGCVYINDKGGRIFNFLKPVFFRKSNCLSVNKCPDRFQKL